MQRGLPSLFVRSGAQAKTQEIRPTKSQPEHVPTPRTPVLSRFQLKSSVQISTRSFGMLANLNN
jgi:hypothetical protein